MNQYFVFFPFFFNVLRQRITTKKNHFAHLTVKYGFKMNFLYILTPLHPHVK